MKATVNMIPSDPVLTTVSMTALTFTFLASDIFYSINQMEF